MKIPRLQSVAKKFRQPLTTLCVAAAAALPLAAQAGPFTDMFIFGDSLSDTGNLHAITSVPPASFLVPLPYPPSSDLPPFIGPYSKGRFSNGALWVELLAGRLGLEQQGATASGFPPFVDLTGGHNYAIGGAQTGISGFFEELIPTGIQVQVGIFTGHKPDPNVLYIVLAGGNDIRVAADKPTPTDRISFAASAAQAYGLAIGALIEKGARTILVGNVNDVGKTPEALLVRHNALAATEAAKVFNTTLTQVLDTLETDSKKKGIDIRFIRLDLFGLFNTVFNDATRGGQVFGLSNATMPCFAADDLKWVAPLPRPWPDPDWAGANCETSLFSDVLHPTAALHSILARTAAACRLPDGKFLGGMPPEGSATQGLGRFCRVKQPTPQ